MLYLFVTGGGSVRFKYMNTLRLSLLAVILLVLAPFTLRAQFLGQQSLSESSYVIDQSGNLWSWGRNLYGQLGVGDRTDRNTPTMVPVPPGASKWVLVAGGASFAVAVADSDKLYAWGLNDKGQIGTGIAGGLYVAPVRIQNPPYVTTWKWVSAGADHSEALTTDGRLFAWGDNAQGQLGVGNTEYLLTPQPVEFPTGVSAWGAVAAGPGYTMMLSQSGLLYGCGMDSLSTFQPFEGPVLAQIDPFRVYSPLPCIAASYRLESRIDQNADLPGPYYKGIRLLWIAPTHGNIDSIAAVADGGRHALLLSMLGTLGATGDNTYGQLGIGVFGTKIKEGIIPFPSGVTQFVAIAAGLNHSLAVGNDGWLYAWGDNSVGELGVGAAPNQAKPVKVLKVCASLAMSGSSIAPATFTEPYTITLVVSNGSSGLPLTNADAFLVLGAPLTYLDSVPDKRLSSQVLPGNSDSISWNGTIQYFSSQDTAIFFAYIRANGSAPLFITGKMFEPGTTFISRIFAHVQDSITGQPVSGAKVLGVRGVDTTDEGGNFIFTLPLDSFFSCEIVKENYNTASQVYYMVLDTLTNLTFLLGPSNIRGTFVLPAPPFVGDSILQVYYPDSLIGFALSRREIFRTRDSGINWSALYEANEDLHDVKFRDPTHGWVVGDGGTILNTTDTGETWQPGTIFFGGPNGNSTYFLNASIGYSVGDGGSSSVTYDAGASWAPMPEFPHNATSINFFSLAGHAAADEGVLNYDGEPSVVNSIVRGRLTFGNPPEPIMGANVDRYYVVVLGDTDTVSSLQDNAYTNEQGNFVFSGIDGAFPYEYRMHFTDSGIAKTKTFSKIKGKLHEIITLNYNDYAPSPPDTVLSVSAVSEAALSLEVSSSESYARIFYSLPSSGRARLVLQDVLGRTVRTISDGFSAAGPQQTEVSLADVPAGAYYITLETGEGSLTRKFVIVR